MHINLHKSATRGSTNFGWLESKHTYSFGHYYNPDRMGFGVLRVINDDIVAAGAGFDTHAHRDMEIISIPLSGALRHKDSMNNQPIIEMCEIQIMSAGSGVQHSEYNRSNINPVNFLQIWIEPKHLGINPRYEQKHFDKKVRLNECQLVVSPQGTENSLTINQDAYLSLATITANNTIHYAKHKTTHAMYVFVIDGAIAIEGHKLNYRDGAEITADTDNVKTPSISIHSITDTNTEILVIEIPAIKANL